MVDLVGFVRREIRRPIAMASVIAAGLSLLGMFPNLLAVGLGKMILIAGLVFTAIWIYYSAV